MAQKFNHPMVAQVSEPVDFGEAPVWERRLGKLFFIDVHNGRVMAYDYETQAMEIAAEFPGHICSIIPTKSDPHIMVAGLGKKIAKITLYDKSAKPEVIYTLQNDQPRNNFGDGKADNKGRIWTGTIGDNLENGLSERNTSVLYKFTKENLSKPAVMIPNISVSNGLTWSVDGTVFYYIDSLSEEIAQYDFNAETGEISNRKVVFNIEGKGLGYLDGMTRDEDGNLWVALYAGGSVIQIDPSKGTLLRRIAIPALHASSVTWGGPNLDILFVTTGRKTLTPKEMEGQPGAGCLFAITNLGTKGVPDYEADI